MEAGKETTGRHLSLPDGVKSRPVIERSSRSTAASAEEPESFFPGEPFPRHATSGSGGGGVTDIYGAANSPSPFSSPEVLANLMLWRRKIVGFNTNHVSIVT